MIEINNITYIEYSELKDKNEYDYCIKFAYSFNKPVDILKIGDLTEQKFGIVKDMQYDFQNGITWEQLFDYIFQMKGSDIKSLAAMKLINLCQIKSYLKSEIERINDIESIVLTHDVDEDEIRAGIEELSQFGIYMQLRQIALTFHKSINEIKHWKYDECFTELVVQKKLSEYQENLFEIKKKKD
jgi:hypothetical protein